MLTLLEMTAQIVSSHASSSQMSQDELLKELQQVYTSLKSLEAGSSIDTNTSATTEVPQLTIKQAFKKNEVICMLCGKGGMKILTPHIKTVHDLKPGAYKKQFGIKSSQPLTAKSYSESRKQMALDAGLADKLAKAREVRMAKIQSKKNVPVVKAKAPVPAVKTKAPVPAKVQGSKAPATKKPASGKK